ncbi:MAG: cytidine deaminase [Halolamina sp.]|uniref:cytidine deaminase n=1 Tax=Halolamina sp. TaxID=1940283 RepID=UPI002FC3CD07
MDEGSPAVDPAALLEQARGALDAAYVPYSEYTVGAAVLTEDGSVFTGCNIENANYSNSLHAEEVAVGSAVRAGHRSIVGVAVSSGARDGVTPCGMCRQTLAEFGDEDIPVYCDEGDGEWTEHRLGELIPDTITPEMLGVDPTERAAGDDAAGE